MPPAENDNQVFLLLGRLEGKVDQVLRQGDDHSKRLDSQDARLDRLEASATTRAAERGTLIRMVHIVWAVAGAVGASVLHWLTSGLKV